MTSRHRLAVFVSGEGSLFQSLTGSQNQKLFSIEAVVTSNSSAPAVGKAKALGIPVLDFKALDEDQLLEALIGFNVNFVVLAGFLKKVPSSLIHHFRSRMINTHPSLLPKYGGKGMYGLNVHRAVLEGKETQSGCTTHFVTEKYDEGEIIRQQIVAVACDDTAESLQNKVKLAERENLLETLKLVLDE